MRNRPSLAALVVLLLFPAVVVANPDGEEVQPTQAEKAPDAATVLGDRPAFELEARLGALWAMTDREDDPVHEFEVSHARLQLTWEQWKIVKARISVDLEQLVDEGDPAILRDLWIGVRPADWLGVRIGQFKKPFSRIELTSYGKLPLIRRGISNRYLVEHLGYGDRDLGLMLEGRLVPDVRLDYAVGVFNGRGRNRPELSRDGSMDLAARLEARPAKWISLGASGSLKLIDEADLPALVDADDRAAVDEDAYPLGYGDEDFVREHGWMAGPAWMAGADAALKVGGLRVAAEGMFGENWWFERYPLAWSGLLMLSYRLPLGERWPIHLEPALRGEVLTILTSTSLWRARLWQLAPGINLHVGEHVRLMLDGEFVFAQGTEADLDGSRRDGLWPNEWPGSFADSKRLLVQLLFEV
jgi:hypothetical protein